MNKILIVDASASDYRVMSSLLSKAGYDPIGVDSIEAGKVEAAKLPPGAVIVTAMRLSDGTGTDEDGNGKDIPPQSFLYTPSIRHLSSIVERNDRGHSRDRRFPR